MWHKLSNWAKTLIVLCAAMLFTMADQIMSEFGWNVLNPAKLPDGLPADKYMPIRMAMIDAADMLMLLPGWETSPGAQLEAKYATYQGIPVRVVESLIPFRAHPLCAIASY